MCQKILKVFYIITYQRLHNIINYNNFSYDKDHKYNLQNNIMFTTIIYDKVFIQIVNIITHQNVNNIYFYLKIL